MKVNIISESVKYGVICGLLALLLMFGGWSMGTEQYVSILYITTFIPYMIIILIIGGIQVRKANDNLLPYKEALKFTFLAYVIAGLLIAIGTYLLYNVIDKEVTQRSLVIRMEKTRKMMEAFGASESDIDKALEEVEKESADTGFKKIFLGYGLGLIWDFVKSLLIALIIRKEKNVTFE